LIDIPVKIAHYKNNSKRRCAVAAKNYKPVTDLFKESSRIVRRNLYPFIIVSLLSALSVVWQMGINVHDKTTGTKWRGVFEHGVFGNGGGFNYPGTGAGVLAILFVIASVVLALMSVILSVKAASQKTVELGEVWEEFKLKGLRLLGVVILTGLIIIVGLVLLIIPGLYFLGRLILAPILLVDQNTAVREAINRSWELTKDQMLPVYTAFLFGIVMELPSIIPIIGPLIAFVLTFLYSVALPLRYFELKSKAKA
jgi:hypothetical protein